MKLNLGCGFNKQEGYVNVDMYDACSPNVLHNLEIFPWPFSDGSADEILFNHSLEHLGQQSDVFLKIMQETYRVAKDGATVYINVPHPRHDNFISDPTHVRAITPMTLQLFDLDLNRHWQKTGAANSPLAIYLNVNFKLIHTNITLEPEQLEELQAGRLSNQQISDLIKRSNNIASEYRFTLKVVK